MVAGKPNPIRWQVKQNLITDYCYGQLGIEAKTIGDYFSSLTSGHLQHQLENMDDNFNHMVLVIHGTVDQHVANMRKRRIKVSMAQMENMFIGSLARFDVDFDMTIMHFTTSSAAARWIVKRCSKDGTTSSGSTYRTLRRTTSEDVRVDGLRAIGCSEAIAKRLLEHFGSIAEICNATSKELMKIEGVGKIRANSIVSAFNSEESVLKERVKITRA